MKILSTAVIALSLAYFSSRYADDVWYQTAPMLVVAYAIMFFPLALVGVRASVAQAPPGLAPRGATAAGSGVDYSHACSRNIRAERTGLGARSS